MSKITDILEQIRKADIEAVFEHYGIPVAGNKADCPFCGGQSTIAISREKGLWYCFKCEAGGDIISFVMRKENLGFTETVGRIGEILGLNK